MTSDGQSQALAPVPEKIEKPLITLPVPVLGVMTNEKQWEWFSKLAERWNDMPEEVKDAMILMERPVPVSGGGLTHYAPYQALMIVRYCKQKGIGVHSDTWWFDTKNCRIGSTVSGLREEARHRGLDLGAPVLRFIDRPWPEGKPRIPGFDKDIGYHCEIAVGSKGAPASCEVWLSSAYQDKSPVWKSNTDHMLQVRAIGTCTKFAMGSGISQMPEDVDEKEEK